MRATEKELLTLLRLLDITRAEEIDCEEFLCRVSRYLEKAIDPGSLSVSDEAFLHHLRICPECLEEYQALLRALQDQET